MTTGTEKQKHHTITIRTNTGATVTLDSATIDAFAARLQGDLLPV